jgi:hypothetical protein
VVSINTEMVDVSRGNCVKIFKLSLLLLKTLYGRGNDVNTRRTKHSIRKNIMYQ